MEGGSAGCGVRSAGADAALPAVAGIEPYAAGPGWAVYCADVLSWLALQPEHQAALIVCDPPYHRTIDADWDRRWLTDADYLAWLARLRDGIARALHPAGSLYLWASPRMAARVEVLLAERLAVLSHVVWAKWRDGRPFGAGCRTRKRDLRAFFPISERLLLAEHANSDGHAMSGAGYTLACDGARGHVMEPLRAYLDGERRRAGVSPGQIGDYFGERGWPRFVHRHWFTASQWEMPTAENYQRLRECLAALGRQAERGEYLRADYEDLRADYEYLRADYEYLRADYEDLRRPFRAPADQAGGWWSDVWHCPPVSARPGKHPAEKPAEIAAHVVAVSSRPGHAVWDICAGSGAFAAAAVAAGLPAVAVEESPQWCEQIANRLRAAEEAQADAMA